MSSFENVIGGKLKLKGKPLAVAGGIKKKKKKKKESTDSGYHSGEQTAPVVHFDENDHDAEADDTPIQDAMTPAEKRFQEIQKQREQDRASKLAKRSHRQKVEEFNKYLANLSEHYDIPKVGPG